MGIPLFEVAHSQQVFTSYSISAITLQRAVCTYIVHEAYFACFQLSPHTADPSFVISLLILYMYLPKWYHREAAASA